MESSEEWLLMSAVAKESRQKTRFVCYVQYNKHLYNVSASVWVVLPEEILRDAASAGLTIAR